MTIGDYGYNGDGAQKDIALKMEEIAS